MCGVQRKSTKRAMNFILMLDLNETDQLAMTNSVMAWSCVEEGG